MVKRKVVWTKIAISQRRSIFTYWNTKNRSNTYSKRLLKEIQTHTSLIAQNPLAFKETNLKGIRVCVLGHFGIFYTHNSQYIYILSFWDNRQNPDKLLELLNTSL